MRGVRVRAKVPLWGGHTKMQVPPLAGQGFRNLFFIYQRTAVTGTAVSSVSLYLINRMMHLHTEAVESHTEVSSSLRILNTKAFELAMCSRDSWKREWQIIVKCPLIAVLLSRFAAKFSSNRCFFSCGGSLLDR